MLRAVQLHASTATATMLGNLAAMVLTLGAAAARSSVPVVTPARRSTLAIPSEASGQERNHKTLDVAVAGQGSGWASAPASRARRSAAPPLKLSAPGP